MTSPLTVIDLVTEALDEIGITPPATIVSTTDKSQRQLRRILHALSRELRNEHIFPQQKKSYSFTTTASRAKYPFPEDFYAFSANTGWDTTNNVPLDGPISDPSWNYRVNGYELTGAPYGVRPFGPDSGKYTAGGQFNVNPTPTSALVFTYEYLTKTLFLPKFWAPITAFALNSFCSANGNIYKATSISGTGTTGATTPPSVTTGTETDNAGANQIIWTYQTAPQETIVLDTDLSIFDDDIMIAGLKYRYLKAKGLDYEIHETDFRKLLQKARGRMKGSFRGSLSRTMDRPRYVTQRGGWTF